MTLKFLKHIWPSQGFYCIAVPVKHSSGSSYYKHSSYNNIEAAAKAAKLIDKNGKDCFMAVGTLKEKRVHDAKADKYRIRTHANMGWYRALILDLDCGEKKPYKNQAEALSHLNKFCKEVDLEKPTIVNSGYGLHVYFTFEEELTAEEWHALTLKLGVVAKDFGLDVDTSRTSDKSSVLRVVGTHNHKRENPAPVKVMRYGETQRLRRIESRLDTVIKDKGLKIIKKREFKPKPNADFEIPEGVKKAFGYVQGNIAPQCDGDKIFAGCNVMGQVLKCRGDIYEPVWFHALQCDRLSDEPRPHDLSDGYANYNPAEVDQKIADFEQKDIGATTCEKFQEVIPNDSRSATWCDGCVHKGRIRSPRELGLSYAKPLNTETLKEAVTTKETPAPTTAVPTPVSVEASDPYEDFDDCDDGGFGGGETITNGLEVLEDTEETQPKATKSDNPKPKTIETKLGFDLNIPEPPAPYMCDSRGIFVIEEDEETDGPGERIRILEFNLKPIELRAEKVEGNFSVVMEASLPNETESRIFELPWEDVVDGKALIKALARKGILALTTHYFEYLKDYMTKYIKELHKLMHTVQKYNQLGWHEDGDTFVLPEETLLRDGTKHKSGVNNALKHTVGSFRKKGSLEEWRKIIDTYNLPGYEPYAFGHLAGYGSLLFRFTDYEGAIVSLVGNSGSGKSTVLKTINSIFGHPIEPMLVQTDTYLARMNRLGVFNSICVTYDEITNINEDELSDLGYSVTQGRGKHRLTQNAEAKENNTTWQMLLVSSSNAALMGKLSSLKHDASAESLRVFEYRVDASNTMSKQEAKIFDNLKHNFGHAGEIFINYVVQHPEKVQDLISNYEIRFDEIANVPITERYWSAIVSSTLAGGEIANSLGLAKFDIEKLFHWAVAQVSNMRSTVTDNRSDPAELLNEYINQNQMAMMVVSDNHSTKNAVYIEREPRTGLLIRADITSQKMYLNKKAFRDWVIKGGGDYSMVKSALKQSKVLLNENMNKTLSAGSKLFPTGQVRCWLVDLSHPSMMNTEGLQVVETNKVSKIGSLDKEETG